MPIAFLVSSMRAALDDMSCAELAGSAHEFAIAAEQMSALIDELERHDGAKDKVAANDSA